MTLHRVFFYSFLSSGKKKSRAAGSSSRGMRTCVSDTLTPQSEVTHPLMQLVMPTSYCRNAPCVAPGNIASFLRSATQVECFFLGLVILSAHAKYRRDVGRPHPFERQQNGKRAKCRSVRLQNIVNYYNKAATIRLQFNKIEVNLRQYRLPVDTSDYDKRLLYNDNNYVPVPIHFEETLGGTVVMFADDHLLIGTKVDRAPVGARTERNL